MIDGLKILITAEELRSKLTARASHHTERVTFYKTKAKEVGALHEEQMTRLREAGIADGRLEIGGSGYSNNVATISKGDGGVAELEGKAKVHRQTADRFTFIAAHLEPNESYRLDAYGHELSSLELVG